MIIECEKCQTKYRFDESMIDGDGALVRCSRCKNVFFQKKPLEEEEAVLPDVPEETADKGSKKKDKEKGFWTPGKLVAYAVIVILVLAGVYVWIFPQTGKEVMDKISLCMSADKLKKQPASVNEKVGEVGFIGVKERFAKNWMSGDLLVIEGIVVNKYDYPISRVKVRCKTLNESGEVLDTMESYCGNILTDEELSNLTETEIAEKLSTPAGSNVPNHISPNGNIPFMIVITNPSKEINEFIVELAEKSSSSE